MKTLLTIAITFLVFFNSSSQCIVDAGPDRALCPVYDTIQLNVSILNAIGSISIRWTDTLALDNSTILYPRIVNPNALYGNPLSITITDSLGNVCSDTVNFIIPSYTFCLADCFYQAHKKEPVNLFTCIHGGIAPLSYSWTPSLYLSDSSVAEPVSRPDSSIRYVCHVRDSAGCKLAAYCDIWVDDIVYGIQEFKPLDAKFFPDPLDRSSRLEFDYSESDNYKLRIYNNVGSKIEEFTHLKSPMPLGELNLSSGLYYLTLEGEEGKVFRSKFAVQ